MLIGLTGRNAAGKGEVARYLQRKSFYYYSLSDAIREEIRSRGEQPTREGLIIIGNELRQKHGAAVLAERILSKIEDDKHYIIDSIRNPAEVEAFREAKHFKLIRVEAPAEIRFQRIVSRHRESDPRTYEEFIALENREAEGDDTSQNLVKVELMADYPLINDGPIERLYVQIDELLPKTRARQYPCRRLYVQHRSDHSPVSGSEGTDLRQHVLAKQLDRSQRLVSR